MGPANRTIPARERLKPRRAWRRVITLIGTGHVFDLRRNLQREVMARAPDVVCLELDPGRMQALLARKRGAKGAPVPYAYKLLAEFQDRMAAERGIAPGDEMLAAFEAAQGAGIPVSLIDVDAQVAFRRLWQSMGFLEKARFFGSAIASTILPRRYVERELEKMQGDYDSLLAELAKDYPTVKRVLIDERNEHMASQLAALRAQGKERVVAVMGDGHVEGIRVLLGGRGLGGEVEVVRLKQLQGPPPAEGTATFSFQTDVSP
jgi:pheromone shutdown protein TraB